MDEMPPHADEEKIKVDYEGRDGITFCERLSDPTIRAQLVDILLGIDERKKGRIEHDVQLDQSGQPIQEGNRFVTKTKMFIPRTREEIEGEVSEKIEAMKQSTEITFGGQEPGHGEREILPINWRDPVTGDKPSDRVWSIIEAHEKGHAIRQYNDAYITKHFTDGFDISAVLFTEKDYLNLGGTEPVTEESLKEMRDRHFAYLFSANELAERMSQLKNYFSMRGDELFSRQHLDYARMHYVEDTGFDNSMSLMFQAITPEKEAYFLELMNSAGI